MGAGSRPIPERVVTAVVVQLENPQCVSNDCTCHFLLGESLSTKATAACIVLPWPPECWDHGAPALLAHIVIADEVRMKHSLQL